MRMVIVRYSKQEQSLIFLWLYDRQYTFRERIFFNKTENEVRSLQISMLLVLEIRLNKWMTFLFIVFPLAHDLPDRLLLQDRLFL